MALSLAEQAKLLPQDASRAFIQLYATSNPLLEIMPVEPVPTGTTRWVKQSTLATAGQRGVNADFTATSGTYATSEATTKIYGGKVAIDRKFATENPASLEAEKIGQVGSFAKIFYTDFFDGDNSLEVYGLKNQINIDNPTQNVSMGSTVVSATSASGIVLTMAKMDELLDAVNYGPNTYIFMNQRPFNALNTLSRTNGVGQQNINYAPGQFGSRTPFYNNIPIVVTRDSMGNDIIAADEMAYTVSGGSGSSTSVYIVTFGPGMVTGFQSKIMSAVAVADATNFATVILEWFCGVAMKHTRSAARLFGVKNAVS